MHTLSSNLFTAALASFVALLIPCTLYAQPITDSFNYQGELNDGGVPANGLYDITFVIYDTQVGGAPLATGTQTVNDVQVTDGRFEAFVNFAGSGALFDSDQTRWVELRVSLADTPSFTTLEPRQRIGPVPVASYALRSGGSLQDAYNNGTEIIQTIGDPNLEIVTATGVNSGISLLKDDDTLAARLFTNAFNGSGSLTLWGAGTAPVALLERDSSVGGGGRLAFARNDFGVLGVEIQGNSNDTESPTLNLVSPTNSIFFDTSATGDDTILLPAEAINAVEMHNEPGLAETESNIGITLTDVASTIDMIDTVTINCPSDGFVFVIASAELTINHITGSTSSVILGVSQNSSSLPANGDLETRLVAGAAAAGYEYAVTTHGVFPVNQGINNFFLLGDKNNTSGSAFVSDIQLTAIFIPTAYGSASIQSTQPGNTLPDELTPITGPMTDYDILLERNASLEANDARIQREMEIMKAQMQELLQQNQRILSEQAVD